MRGEMGKGLWMRKPDVQRQGYMGLVGVEGRVVHYGHHCAQGPGIGAKVLQNALPKLAGRIQNVA